ncbi:MAG: sensor histidine kinase [Bacteroidales bacterium]|nr:sensor histidine kinase [Bacteroidales bacterium]
MKAILNFIKNEYRNILAGMSVGIVITFLFTGFDSQIEAVLLNLVYGILVGLSIALGCGAISRKMFRSENWLDNPVKRYISAVLLVSAYILVDVILLNIVWFKITQEVNPIKLFQSNFFLIVLLIEFVTGLLIYLIVLSRYFAVNLNSFYLQSQKSTQELAKFRFETLKNQVNPHFLFNSLNVLSGMMYKDPERADEFVIRLSNIYRYVLDVQEEDVVELKREMVFTEDYLFLLKLRFREKFSYQISVSGEGFVVPMALQILLENVLKHNAMQSDSVLQISIEQKDDYLVVRNNRSDLVSQAPSTGLGLENVRSRYAHLSDKQVFVNSTVEFFEVQIPVLNLSPKR